MLNDQERRDIEAELEQHEQKRAAACSALKILQGHRGWISDESLRDLAPLLEMTPAELDSLATFYNMIFRQPVGRHVILICDSVSCWVMGYASLRRCLEERLGIELGGTTADGRFTLLPAACLGDCDHAPAMMIDKTLYGNLTPEKMDEILARHP